ncbi:MAG: potassium transporter [Bacteroidetes bacterium]|nr:MAG: potassium transporter [Bacteroidota bacterium]PTM12835.1 MAG: potassium transporter [Bacteroidota bacterium]
MINYRIIAKVLGVLLLIIGALMWTGLPVSWYFQSGDMSSLFWSGVICLGAGGLLRLPRLGADRSVRKREGYLIVALGWLVMVLFGMLPYVLSGVIPGFADALFETVSGMTTTGASVLTKIEGQPEGILYWRSLTQWIGGMGIIVLTVAIFPLLGIGGVELFVAEAPGPTSDKLHPRISETAKRLWLIYVGLTGILALLLLLEGMTLYEAVNHALTTMATGGFSTRNNSMAAFSPTIQYTICVFMFLAGVNYTVIYFGLKGKFKRVWASDEFRAYLGLILLLTVIVTFTVHHAVDITWEQAFRDSIFQIISLITTTGFVSADYTSWTVGLTLLFFITLFIGACAGSTSGGIKIVRNLVFFKNSFLEFKRILHPRAIIPLRLNGEIVKGRIITHIIIFLLLYLMIFIFGSLALAWMGLDFLTAIGAVATSLGNVGPGIGKVGPVDNFAWLPAEAKILLSFLMLLGRLELFTILVLFTPYFWKAN